MPINLSKGQKVDLTKGNPGLKKIMVGLGWDVNAFDSGADFDLDAAAFMVGANGKCPTENEFVFYGNLTHPSEAVKHMGDNLTGEGEGDDEQIEIDLNKIPSNVEKVAFTVTIYDADVRRQNFGQVSNAFIRIVDEVTNTESDMIWEKISQLRQQLWLESFTDIMGSGNSMQLEAASKADLQHFADTMELKLLRNSHKIICADDAR